MPLVPVQVPVLMVVQFGGQSVGVELCPYANDPFFNRRVTLGIVPRLEKNCICSGGIPSIPNRITFFFPAAEAGADVSAYIKRNHRDKNMKAFRRMTIASPMFLTMIGENGIRLPPIQF